MAIEINFDDNVVNGGKSVVSAPDDMDLKFTGAGNQIHNVEKVFHFYNAAHLAALGLSEQTDAGELERVVDQLRAMPDASEAEKIEVVSSSRLKEFLAYGSSITTIAKNVIDMVMKLGGNS